MAGDRDAAPLLVVASSQIKLALGGRQRKAGPVTDAPEQKNDDALLCQETNAGVVTRRCKKVHYFQRRPRLRPVLDAA